MGGAGVWVKVGVLVITGVNVAVAGTGVLVGVGVQVGVGVFTLIGVLVGVGVTVLVGVKVGVGVAVPPAQIVKTEAVQLLLPPQLLLAAVNCTVPQLKAYPKRILPEGAPAGTFTTVVAVPLAVVPALVGFKTPLPEPLQA